MQGPLSPFYHVSKEQVLCFLVSKDAVAEHKDEETGKDDGEADGEAGREAN